MDNTAVPSVQELLVLISDLRQQVKLGADLILALQLELQEKDEVMSLLRKVCLATLAAAETAPVMEGKCSGVVDGESDSAAYSASPKRGKNYSTIEHFSYSTGSYR